MRITTEQMVVAYRETGSVWKAAKKLGTAGQTVWKRLHAMGFKMPSSIWTAEEVEELKRLIACKTIAEIADDLGRPYYGVALKASRLGIVTRYGNRIKRKVPRGSGLTKPVVRRLLEDLKSSDMTIRKFCRQHGMSIDLFAAAVQKHAPDEWKQIAWGRGLEEKECPACGGGFYPMTKKQVCCTRRCASAHLRDQRYFSGNRRKTIGLAEGVCQLCLQPTEKGLSSHHVVGKENDPDDSSLIALCTGCHQLVGIAARRKFLDTSEGWNRLAELVLSRRLAEQGDGYLGIHCCMDVAYLTFDDCEELGLIEEVEKPTIEDGQVAIDWQEVQEVLG